MDGIGILFVKEAVPEILPSLISIYNSSINNRTFPDDFKKAVISSIYKKGPILKRGNYTPVSVLSIISKPLERHDELSFMQFLSSNNRLFQRQSASRKHHSCETALFNVADRWLKAMDCGHLVGTVFLDLSKVHDLIDYDVLMSKLGKYSLSGTLNLDREEYHRDLFLDRSYSRYPRMTVCCWLRTW